MTFDQTGLGLAIACTITRCQFNDNELFDGTSSHDIVFARNSASAAALTVSSSAINGNRFDILNFVNSTGTIMSLTSLTINANVFGTLTFDNNAASSNMNLTNVVVSSNVIDRRADLSSS